MASSKKSKPTAAAPGTQRRTPPPRRPAASPAELTHFFPPGFWSAHRLPVLVLFALAFVLYGATLGFGYLQDDQLVIWDNIFVQKGFGGLGDIFAHDSLLGYYKDPKLMLEGGRYRPLPLATFALEIGLFGKDHPGIAHFFNVLLYGATGVLLYRILSGLFPAKPANEGGKWYFSVPFLAALVYVLHPLHVEAVANIKGRDEILALLGSLGALYAMMKYFDTHRTNWLWASSGFLFLGLLSKENTVTFLAVIPLTLWMFSKVPFGRFATASLVLAVATLLFVIIRYQALGYMVNPGKPTGDLALDPFLGMSLAEKYATIFLTLGWHLKLLFFPHPLTIDYYPYHVPKVNWSDWRAGAALIGYAAMGSWAFLQMRKARATGRSAASLLPAYSILYYLLTISVVSNIFVPTSTFLNERYAYMPSVGFALLVAWFAAGKMPEWLGKPGTFTVPGAALLGLVAFAFGWRVWTRVPDWGGNGEGLVESAVRVSKDSYRANYYYAAMLYEERYQKAQNAGGANTGAGQNTLLDSVDRYVSRALDINPGYRLGNTLKARVAVARYRQDKQLAPLLKTVEDLIQKQPYNGDMLVIVLDALKSIRGTDPNVYNLFCHRIGYGLYFKQKYDLNGALEFLNQALVNYPQDVNIMQDLIEVYTAQGNTAKALELQQQLKALQPR